MERENIEAAIEMYRRMKIDMREFHKESFKDIERKIDMIKEVYNDIDNFKIPEKYPDFMTSNDINFASSRGCNEMIFRSIFIRRIGFTLISKSWIKPLAEWIGDRKVLEVMSGCGSLSYALLLEKVIITATDNCSWKGDGTFFDGNRRLWIKPKKLDAVEAVKKYGKDMDIIIMSWPYMDDNAYKVLLEMRKQNPNCLMIYIGESEGGCTANDKFFETADIIEDESFYKAIENYRTWFGLHDRPILMK